MATLNLKPKVELGIVPTHIKFVGGLVPDEKGCLPRNADGKIEILAELERVQSGSAVAMNAVQISVFPGVAPADNEELFQGIKDLGLTPHIILMVAGGNPMDPADEDSVAAILIDGIKVAINQGVSNVASTSIEEWMKPGATKLTGDAFDAAVAQNVKLHTRVVRESGVLESSIKAWHIEFLRGIEFQTFNDARRCWQIVQAANEELGQPFFKVLVDAAHCGDSELSMEENIEVINEMAAAGGFSMFHASAKTTRGCLSTDDGWIGSLLTACAATGKLESVFVELFHHDDAALEGLRTADPRHGVDTTDGRSYTECVCDGLADVARRLNNLESRGIL